MTAHRFWIAAALVGAAFSLRVAQAQTPALVTDPRIAAAMPQRLALLELAEASLARGETSMAALGFERAGMMLHSADSEMGLVRAWMQSGDYRRAMAFCAHAAGAHRDVPAAAALYAWLLRLGGQSAFAEQVLAEAVERAPDDPVVKAVWSAFRTGVMSASGVLLDLPHRMAPQSTNLGEQTLPATDAAVLGTGALVGGGRYAVVDAAMVQGKRRLWVRNGYGQTTSVKVEPVPPSAAPSGLSLLRLDTALEDGEALVAQADPFGGSPGFVMTFAANALNEPAWPSLHQGFLGRVEGNATTRKLGISLPASATGGPVFDSTGKLVGFARGDAGAAMTLVPSSVLRQILPRADPPADASSLVVPNRIALDAVYERGLRSTLQVIAAP